MDIPAHPGLDEQDPVEAWRKVTRKANKLERTPRG